MNNEFLDLLKPLKISPIDNPVRPQSFILAPASEPVSRQCRQTMNKLRSHRFQVLLETGKTILENQPSFFCSSLIVGWPRCCATNLIYLTADSISQRECLRIIMGYIHGSNEVLEGCVSAQEGIKVFWPPKFCLKLFLPRNFVGFSFEKMVDSRLVYGSQSPLFSPQQYKNRVRI